MYKHNCSKDCPPKCPFQMDYSIHSVECEQPDCENPPACEKLFYTDCIVYTENLFEQYGLPGSFTLTELIQHISNLIVPGCSQQTTTSSTTTQPPCKTYSASLVGGGEAFEFFSWLDCEEVQQFKTLCTKGPSCTTSFTFCALEGSIEYDSEKIIITETFDSCTIEEKPIIKTFSSGCGYECEDVPETTTTSTTTTTQCPDAIFCSSLEDLRCFLYSGCDNECYYVTNNMSLVDLFFNLLQSIDNDCSEISVTTTTLGECEKDLCNGDYYNSHCIIYNGPVIECENVNIYPGDNLHQVLLFFWDAVNCCLPETTTTTTADPCFHNGGDAITTTTPPPCKCYTVTVTDGPITISWLGCDDELNTEEYQEGDIVGLCARQSSVVKESESGVMIIEESINTCEDNVDCWPSFNMSVENLEDFDLAVVESSGQFVVDWGDGTVDSFSAGIQNPIHTYSSDFTGVVKIKAPTLSYILELDYSSAFLDDSSKILTVTGSEIKKLKNLTYFNIGAGANTRLIATSADLPNSLEVLFVYRGNLSGNVVDLPNSLTFLAVFATTLTGVIGNLPSNLTSCQIGGNNTLSGTLESLPPSYASNLVDFEIYGSNTISGTLAGIASYNALVNFRLEGLNTLSGNLFSLLTVGSLENFTVYGKNSISGGLSSLAGLLSLERFAVDNDSAFLTDLSVGNTISGSLVSLPTSIKEFIVGGRNTISGNLSNLSGLTQLTHFDVRGVPLGGNTITGNVSSLTALPLITFILQGQNTITGVIANLPSTLVNFTLSGMHSLSGDLFNLPFGILSFIVQDGTAGCIFTNSAPKIWAPLPGTKMSQFVIALVPSAPPIPSPDLDGLLIDFASILPNWEQSNPPNDVHAITLKGTPSGASSVAQSLLSSHPVTLTIYT